MRTLVVSDLHGNLAALEAVLQTQFDEVLCLGDLVDYGPRPAEVVAWASREPAAVIRGNHDDALARGIPCVCGPDVRALSDATQSVTRAQLSTEHVRFLQSLPVRMRLERAGIALLLCHATPADPLFRYLRATDQDTWAREVAGLGVAGLLVGHTHLPMLLEFERTWVLNPGSVGQPRDGDPRAAFAVLEDGVPRLERVVYDIERTVRELGEVGLPVEHRERLVHLLRTGRP